MLPHWHKEEIILMFFFYTLLDAFTQVQVLYRWRLCLGKIFRLTKPVSIPGYSPCTKGDYSITYTTNFHENIQRLALRVLYQTPAANPKNWAQMTLTNLSAKVKNVVQKIRERTVESFTNLYTKFLYTTNYDITCSAHTVLVTRTPSQWQQ